MARHEKPPEGFAVAHLPDGRYYPLRVERCYSAQHPDGMLTLYPHSGRKGDDTASFALRGEALTFCRELAALNAEAQRGHFEHMAVESDCYPERCAWYRDLIEEVTGNPPQIIRWHRCIWVIVPGYFCPTCGCAPFYVPRSDPDKIDVNVRCLDGIDLAAIRPQRFDGRNWEHAITDRVPWR